MDLLSIALLSTLFLPFSSFLFLIFSEKIVAVRAGIVAAISSAFSLLSTLFLLFSYRIDESIRLVLVFPWIRFSSALQIDLKFLLTQNAVWMAAVVSIVSFLVVIYSIEYKKGDAHYNRFFAYLGLFVFTMMGIVWSNNLLITFIFWELVGFTSYLLIGFWLDKKKAVQSNKNAFLINRVSDVFFIVGLLIIWNSFGSFDLELIVGSENNFNLAVLFIFIGCMGKSAQFPFQVWLPDAMEGPTPVSALIHAATMVAAGIYLMVNLSPLITPEIGDVILIIGCVTAFIGAFSAITQYDLKRILAYSTISQLGFMMAAIGIGASQQAFFHLITHAFFKAGLFLCAGSIIHSLQQVQNQLKHKQLNSYFDKQDIRNMGGMLKLMPYTSIAFIICALALAGVPFFSGFISKDSILLFSFDHALHSMNWVQILSVSSLFITAFMTSFYVFRMIFKVFYGQLKVQSLLQQHHFKVHESAFLIVLPLIILSLLSIGFVYSSNPLFGETIWLFDVNYHSKNHFLISVFSSIISISAAILVGILYKYNNFRRYSATGSIPLNRFWTVTYKLSFHHFYLDRMPLFLSNSAVRISYFLTFVERTFIDRIINLFGVLQVVLAHVFYWIDIYIIDGLVLLVPRGGASFSNQMRLLQTGKIQTYFKLVLLFISLIIISVFFLI